jgi:hypothetical protein
MAKSGRPTIPDSCKVKVALTSEQKKAIEPTGNVRAMIVDGSLVVSNLKVPEYGKYLEDKKKYKESRKKIKAEKAKARALRLVARGERKGRKYAKRYVKDGKKLAKASQLESEANKIRAAIQNRT